MNRLLIVDGHNLLFQMFFGMPSRIVNKDGKAIQGTLGFVGALLKMIRKVEPTHVAVLFDGEHQNDRAALEPEYKANRTDYSTVPEDMSPFSQLSDVYRALDVLGIKYTEISDGETDDAIASYALRYGWENEIVIASFDSDFFQLITDNVTVLRYRGDSSIICDRAYIKGKLGIEPEKYADFKSLTGDAADNIRGADKVGQKTAASLISEFGSLEGVIASAEQIKKPSVRASVISCSERLRKNYILIKLTNRAKIPFELCSLEYDLPQISTTEVLRKIGIM